MATVKQNLMTRRAAIAAELAAGQTPDGQSFRKPNISVDGESRDSVGYVKSLREELKDINALLADPMTSVTDEADITGSFEIISEGDT